MSTQAATPNLDAALDASTAIAAGAAEVDESTLTDLEILSQEDDVPVVDDKPAEAPADGGEKPAEEVSPEAAKPAEDGVEKTEEQKAEEAKLAAKPAEEELTPADKAVRQLKDSIGKDPVLAKALDANPALRNQLWRNARLAQETEGYKQHFATVEMARLAREDSEDLTGIENNYFSGDVKGHDALLKHFFDADVVRDAKGEPIKDASGNFQTKGNYDKFFYRYRETEFYPAVLQLAKREGQEAEINEAISTIRSFLGEVEPTAAAKPAAKVEDDSRLTPAEKTALAEHQSLKSQQAQADQGKAEAYSKSVTEAVDAAATGFLLKRAQGSAPALSEALQKKLASDTFKEIQEIAKKDGPLGRLREQMLRPGTEDARKLWAAHVVQYVEARYRPILQKLVNEYSTPVVKENETTRLKLDQQKKRTEVRGAAGAPTTSIPADDLSAAIREGDELSRKIHNRPLSSTEIMDIEDLLPTLRQRAALVRPAAKR